MSGETKASLLEKSGFLESENRGLIDQIAKLESEKRSSEHDIRSLQKKLKKCNDALVHLYSVAEFILKVKYDTDVAESYTYNSLGIQEKEESCAEVRFVRQVAWIAEEALKDDSGRY